MVRSSGFGSTTTYYYRPIQTRFRFGSVTLSLNLAYNRNSPARSTKSTTSDWLPVVLCLLVSTRFQVLFHSPPGVLFTFPSRYYSLSVTWSYLALWDGPHIFRQNSSCSDVLAVSGQRLFSPTSLSLSLGLLSNNLRLRFSAPFDTRRVFLPLLRAGPFSLATTRGIVFTFFSSGY